jgi:signal transduction histidine kinase
MEYVKELLKLKKAVDNNDAGEAVDVCRNISRLEATVDFKGIADELPQLLKDSQDGIERIQKIVSDLKTFSRQDKGLVAPADLNDILDRSINISWNEIKYKAELVKKYEKLPQVECNAQQIGQVFINLLVNAAQAIKKQGVIVLKTYQDDARVFMEISDTGSGIPPENLNRIFEPFFTTKEVGKGTGLGLSISYEVIKKHKGVIDVKSEIGKGTTFIVSLPKKVS